MTLGIIAFYGIMFVFSTWYTAGVITWTCAENDAKDYRSRYDLSWYNTSSESQRVPIKITNDHIAGGLVAGALASLIWPITLPCFYVAQNFKEATRNNTPSNLLYTPKDRKNELLQRRIDILEKNLQRQLNK